MYRTLRALIARGQGYPYLTAVMPAARSHASQPAARLGNHLPSGQPVKQTRRDGPKRRRWRRRDLRRNRMTRHKKGPGYYMPNIERRERLATLLTEDYTQ